MAKILVRTTHAKAREIVNVLDGPPERDLRLEQNAQEIAEHWPAWIVMYVEDDSG